MSTQVEPSTLTLTHGQILWVLARGNEPSQELKETVKYLRKLGVPFSKKSLGVGRGSTVTYRFEHLMELSVALLLRGRGMDLRDIAFALRHLRSELSPLYFQATAAAPKKGFGAPVTFRWDGMAEDERPIVVEGIYVDLGLYLQNGRWHRAMFRPMGPVEAVRALKTMGRDLSYRGFIALSKLARLMLGLAQNAPEIRRGPR